MKQIKTWLVMAFIAGFFPAKAQKLVEGVKFRSCMNQKELPHDFYKGKFLVLDFWATWCGPCIASFPKVNALQKKYKNNPKIIFASVSAESPGHLDTFFHRKKDIMPGVLHLADDSGTTFKYFEIDLIPHVLVFAPSGKMVFSGRVEDLAKCMHKLLKGENMLNATQPKSPAKDKWATYQKNGSFIAIAAVADTAEESNSNTYFSSDRSSAKVEENNIGLIDIIATTGNLTSIALKYNDSVKARQSISMYYKQDKNYFPEFDKGLFEYQYQNHILDMLEKIYSFRCEWIMEKMTAYKIIIKDPQKLAAAATISTHGSYGSRNGSKYNFVNQTLSNIATTAEDGLNLAVIADTGGVGYDIEVDFSSFASFKKSLSQYGLGVEKVEGYEKKKLNLTFY